jgi:hypothetical protein
MSKDILSEVNRGKSKNGNRFESFFEERTGLKKLLKKEKPTIVNEHGVKQIADFDFLWEKSGVKNWIDVTTSYRSDRAKQKAYNGLIAKKIDPNCIIWMVVGDFVHNKRVQKPTSLEGLDKTIHIDEFLEQYSNE